MAMFLNTSTPKYNNPPPLISVAMCFSIGSVSSVSSSPSHPTLPAFDMMAAMRASMTLWDGVDASSHPTSMHTHYDADNNILNLVWYNLVDEAVLHLKKIVIMHDAVTHTTYFRIPYRSYEMSTCEQQQQQQQQEQQEQCTAVPVAGLMATTNAGTSHSSSPTPPSSSAPSPSLHSDTQRTPKITIVLPGAKFMFFKQNRALTSEALRHRPIIRVWWGLRAWDDFGTIHLYYTSDDPQVAQRARSIARLIETRADRLFTATMPFDIDPCYRQRLMAQPQFRSIFIKADDVSVWDRVGDNGPIGRSWCTLASDALEPLVAVLDACAKLGRSMSQRYCSNVDERSQYVIMCDGERVFMKEEKDGEKVKDRQPNRRSKKPQLGRRVDVLVSPRPCIGASVHTITGDIPSQKTVTQTPTPPPRAQTSTSTAQPHQVPRYRNPYYKTE